MNKTHLIIINIDVKIYKVKNWKVINIKSGKCERKEIDRENNSHICFYFNKFIMILLTMNIIYTEV